MTHHFECPNCKQAAPVVKLLVKDYPHVKPVYRHFPLESVYPHALMAAEAAECAAAQGQFWPMHDLLFEHQHELKLHHLRQCAKKIELDLVRFTAEMKDHLYVQRIREHVQGEESGVRATPAFFVDGKIADTSFGIDRLFRAVEEAAR